MAAQKQDALETALEELPDLAEHETRKGVNARNREQHKRLGEHHLAMAKFANGEEQNEHKRLARIHAKKAFSSWDWEKNPLD